MDQGEVETTRENVVDTFSRDVFDATVPMISGMKSMFERMTSTSVDISNRRLIHLASSLSPSKSFSWAKRGAIG